MASGAAHANGWREPERGATFPAAVRGDGAVAPDGDAAWPGHGAGVDAAGRRRHGSELEFLVGAGRLPAAAGNAWREPLDGQLGWAAV